MSLQNIILSIISGITDPSIRLDIATTINYIFGLYCDRSVGEDEIRKSLYEICHDVISYTSPELSGEALVNAVNMKVDELMRAFRLESLKRRTIAGLKPRYGLPL
jgi:hypothetical protein